MTFKKKKKKPLPYIGKSVFLCVFKIKQLSQENTALWQSLRQPMFSFLGLFLLEMKTLHYGLRTLLSFSKDCIRKILYVSKEHNIYIYKYLYISFRV